MSSVITTSEAKEPILLPPPPAAPPVSVRHAVPRVIEAIRTEAWAITDSAMSTICAIASRENEISVDALEALQAKRVAGTFDLRTRDGVGLMSVQGPLVKHADMFSMISGATSYEGIRRDLETAARDPNIRSVLISFDSPGGMVNGCAECADAIRALGEIKPVEAYVSGTACSAAYWLATACNKITLDRTADVGSIGVVQSIRDSSERDARNGVKTTEFVSSRAPNKRVDYGTDEGRAKVMRYVDSLEDIFISSVAANRGTTVDDVAINFGQGDVEVGAAAVRVGMADAVGSFEQVFARLKQGNGQTARITKEDLSMSQFTQAQLDEARATAAAEARATALAEAQTTAATAADTAAATAATAAQTRIAAILDSDPAKTRASQAKHLAFKTSMSAEEAIDLMNASAEDKGGSTAAGGQRSQEAAGGLALASLDTGAAPDKDKPAPKVYAIDTAGIFARRAAGQKTA